MICDEAELQSEDRQCFKYINSSLRIIQQCPSIRGLFHNNQGIVVSVSIIITLCFLFTPWCNIVQTARYLSQHAIVLWNESIFLAEHWEGSLSAKFLSVALDCNGSHSLSKVLSMNDTLSAITTLMKTTPNVQDAAAEFFIQLWYESIMIETYSCWS